MNDLTYSRWVIRFEQYKSHKKNTFWLQLFLCKIVFFFVKKVNLTDKNTLHLKP